MKATASSEANQAPSSPSHRHRLRKTTASSISDNEDFVAGTEDPVINFLGFDSDSNKDHLTSNKSSLIRQKKLSTSSDFSSSHRIIYEINRTTSISVKSPDTPGICRRHYPSYAEKVAASSHDQSEYEELLRVKKNRQDDENKGGFIGYTTTTDSLSHVLNSFERESFVLSDEHDLLVSPFDASDEDSINQFIEREARVYREAKLYQEIEAELIETVGVIERIGRSRRCGDWRHSVIQINEADRINMVNACALELDALNRTTTKQQSTKDRQNSLKARKKQSSLREKLRRPFRQRNKLVSKTINEASDEDCDSNRSRQNTPVVKRANFDGSVKSPKLIRTVPTSSATDITNADKSPKLNPRLKASKKYKHGIPKSVGLARVNYVASAPPTENQDEVFKYESNSSDGLYFTESDSTSQVPSVSNQAQCRGGITTRVTLHSNSHKMSQKSSKSPSIIRRLRGSSDRTSSKKDSTQFAYQSEMITGRSALQQENDLESDNKTIEKSVSNKGVTKSRSFNLGKVFPTFTKKQSKNADVVATTTATSSYVGTIMNDNMHTGILQSADDGDQRDDVDDITNVSEINSTAQKEEQPTGAFLDIDLSVGEVINEKASIDSFLQINNANSQSGEDDFLANSTTTLEYSRGHQLSLNPTSISESTMTIRKSLSSTTTSFGGSLDSTTATPLEDQRIQVNHQPFKTVTLTIGKSLSSTTASIGASFDSTTTIKSVSEGSEFDIIDKDDPALLVHQHRDKEMTERESKNDMDLSSLIDFANILSRCKP